MALSLGSCTSKQQSESNSALRRKTMCLLLPSCWDHASVNSGHYILLKLLGLFMSSEIIPPSSSSASRLSLTRDSLAEKEWRILQHGKGLRLGELSIWRFKL
jgi:hypothetical protein